MAFDTPRRLGVLTTGRQDWGILRSTCLQIRENPAFDLCLLIGGMHCSARFGQTRRLIEDDGLVCKEALPWVPDSEDLPPHEQAGRATEMVGNALTRHSPEALLLVGDRFETAAAALAATVCRVPLIHVHGGEESEGAFDNALRHAITKLSHLHLVSHPEHASRVVAMGEHPATVHVVGAPGLDNLHRTDLAERPEIEEYLGMALSPPVILVTLHPATLGGDPTAEVDAVCDAMRNVPATYVITQPNADPGNVPIRKAFAALSGPRCSVVEALGDRRYWGLMRLADAMVGNSSSALIEAPVLGLPAVNIGRRQKGRLRGANVLDTSTEPRAIAAALSRALSPSFREQVRCAPCPFGDGHSASRIVSVLHGWVPPSPPIKRFYGGSQ